MEKKNQQKRRRKSSHQPIPSDIFKIVFLGKQTNKQIKTKQAKHSHTGNQAKNRKES